MASKRRECRSTYKGTQCQRGYGHTGSHRAEVGTPDERGVGQMLDWFDEE